MKPGAVLQAILDDQGLTHLQLAQRVGITPNAVSNRTRDVNSMKASTLINMYAAVGYQLVATPKDGNGPEYVLEA